MQDDIWMDSPREERRQLLESFGWAPATLSAALRTFPRRMWVYKVSKNAGSIHDIVWQLADNEVIEFIYCRRFIADRRPTLGVVGSSDSLGYFYQNIKEAMAIIRALRSATYRFLQTLPEMAWDSAIELPTYGTLTLHQWLKFQERCIPEHVGKMHQIYVAWLDDQAKSASAAFGPNKGSIRVSAGAEESPDGLQQ